MLQPCGFIRSLDVIGVRPRGLCFKLVSDKLEARAELDRRSLEKAASILEIELGTQAYVRTVSAMRTSFGSLSF